MLNKLGSLFKREKLEETHSSPDIRTENKESEINTNTRKGEGLKHSHSWSSSSTIAVKQISATEREEFVLNALDEELETTETFSDDGDDRAFFSDPEDEIRKPRRRTLTDKFFSWISKDNNKDSLDDNVVTSDSDDFTSSTPISIPDINIEQVIIDNYTPGPNAGKKSFFELMKLSGHLQDCYKTNDSQEHILDCFFTTDEVLLSSSCSVWIDDRAFLGEIHLTNHFICFDSRPLDLCRFVLPLSTIMDFELVLEQMESSCWFPCETLTNPPPQSIHISSNAQHYFFFGFNDLDEIKNFFDKIKIQAKLSKKEYSLDVLHQYFDNSCGHIDDIYLNLDIPHVLPFETIIDERCNLVKVPHHIGTGKLYFSDCFLCFYSKESDFEWNVLNIPIIDIIHLELIDKDTTISIKCIGNDDIHLFSSKSKQTIEIIKSKWNLYLNLKPRDYTALWGINPNGDRCQQELKLRQSIFLDELNYNQELSGKWKNYFDSYGSRCSIIREPQLYQLTREFGISHEYRGYVWQLTSGSLFRMMCSGGNEVSRLLDTLHDTEISVTWKEIEKDLHRSLPNHPHFRPGGTGIQELRRVLCAYSIRNPDIGYCQSMNIVCAVFLLFMSEEEVFWLMTVVAEKLLPEYYASPLAGLMTDQKIIQILAEEHIPGVSDHLMNLGIALSILTMPWFLCLFINFLPWDVCIFFIYLLFFIIFIFNIKFFFFFF